MKKCIKSVISMIIALTMLVPTVLPVSADTSYGFSDFPTGWSAPAMSHAVANGLIKGKSSDRIAPQDNLTRAEMATIINRAFGATVTKDISAFSDVSSSQWYYTDIQKAYNMQTLYGDAGGTMRPDAFIIREEAIAIVARAMVLSGYDASNLDRFKDKADIADWAIDPLASMAANGYVNGDENSRMNPKAFITREEFAQLLYNIIKHYYNPESKQESYQGNLMLNKPNISLEKITVNGDLVLGDGVGTSVITLTDVKIEGRLLVRGAAQITLKNVTTGKGVVVKNVNGTVHFDNYREEKVFDGVVEHTTVTYKKKATTGGGGGGGTPPAPTAASYKVEHYQEALDGSFVIADIENLSGAIGATATAVAKTYEGFTEDAVNPSRVPTGTIASDGSLVLKLYYTRNSYDIVYDHGEAGGSTTVSLKYGAPVGLEAPTVAAPAGKYFAGWFTAPTGGTQLSTLTVPAGGTTIYAQWTDVPPATVNFTVEHYQQNIDGTYPALAAESEIKTATVATVVKAEDYDKTYTDFTVDLASSLSVAVVADGSSVLKIYYTRNSYDVVYNYGEAGGSATVSVKFGADIDLSAPAVAAPAGKYFAGWFDAATGGTQYTTLTVPSGGITIYAQWSNIPPQPANFTVNHYKQAVDGTYSIAPETETKSAIAGTFAKAEDYDKTYTDFAVDLANSHNVVVLANGTTVLNIYYTRNSYDVVYNYGEAGGSATVSLKFEAAVDLSAPAVSAPAGKFFAGWFDAATGGTKYTTLTVPSGGTTIYAQWSSELPVNFTVEHYKQNIDGTYPSAASESETKQALKNTTVTADEYDKTYTGFTVNLSASTDVTVAADGSSVLKIYYTRNEYTFVFDYDGATGGNTTASQTYKYEEDFNLPVPTKGDEFGFGGWYTGPDGTGTKIEDKSVLGTTITQDNTTLYANWIQKYAYTVKYLQQNAEDNDYTVVSGDTKTLYGFDGEVVVVTNDKSYEGFTYDSSSVTTGTVSAVAPLVIELKYNRNVYDITYNYGEAGGQRVEPLRYGQSVSLAAPSVAAPAGKYFAGWYDAATGGTKYDALTVPVNGTTIYAQWSDNPSYTVEHYQENLDGTYPSVATESETIQAALNEIVTAVEKTYTGFTYSHGDKGATGTNDGTLIFKLYYIRDTYTLTFDYDGGVAGAATQDYKYGQPENLPDTTKQGYTFGGWYTQPGGNGQKLLDDAPVSDVISANTTVYANWLPAPVGYTVEHYKQNIENDGYPAVPETTTGTEYTNSTVSGKASSFNGFTVDPNAAGTVDSATVAADGSTTLKYYYTRNYYDVVYDYGEAGGSHTISLKYEAAINLSVAPSVTVPGKYFAGWADAAGNKYQSLTVPVGGTTIYALWSDNPHYTVEHYQENIDGTYPSVATETESIQAELNATVYATVKNYTGFTENTTHPDRKLSGTNDGNLILKVFYKRNTYNVTFETGAGSAVQPKEYKYGESFVEPATTRQYYKVEGWYTGEHGTGTRVDSDTLAGTAPLDSDIILYANWVLDWDGKVKFTANVTKADLDNNKFSILVDVSNNPIGISEYELTLEWDNTQVKALLSDEEVVKDLKGEPGGFGTNVASIITSADSVTTEDGAAALSYVTVNWNNATNVAGNANLFEIRFEITGTSDDIDHEYVPIMRMFRMTRSVDIDGLKHLPFKIKDVVVKAKMDNGTEETLEKETVDANLMPYKIDHWKENPNDDGYTVAYTEYGHEILGKVIFVSSGREEYIRSGFTVDWANSVDEAEVTAEGAFLRLYYLRPRYEVKFDYQGATTVPTPAYNSVSLKLGATVKDNLPDEGTFAKTDYNFGGWYTEPNGGGTFVDANYGVPEGGVTLYAHWIQTPYEIHHYFETLTGTYEIDENYTEKKDAKAGTEVTATPETTLVGFVFDGDNTNNVLKATVVEDTEDPTKVVTILKIYYNRKTFDIIYDAGEGDIDESQPYDKEFKYGKTATLAKATHPEDKVLGGWYTEADGHGTKVTDTAKIPDALLGNLKNNTIKLYANWVDAIGYYSIEYYQENLDGSGYTIVSADTKKDLEEILGKTVKVETEDPNYAEKYEGFTVNTSMSVLSEELENVRGTILKVYYDRNEYTLKYDYQDADKVGIASKVFKYGEKIAFPGEGTFSKEGFYFAGWYKSTNFVSWEQLQEGVNKIEDVVSNLKDDTEATIYAKWAEFYTVTFRRGGVFKYTYEVNPEISDTVPYSEFPVLKDGIRYQTGYKKNEEVSSVYASDPYEHKIEGGWYYFDENGNELEFTDKTVVKDDLTVRYKFRTARLELDVEKISQIINDPNYYPSFSAPFAEDTRFIDTLKDAAFNNQETIVYALENLGAQDKFTTLNTKLVEILSDKGIEVTPGRIFADDGEILKQHIKFNAFSYLEESKVKTIVVNAIKTTFKNDPLRMRGVIDEMMKEQDKDVIDLMDTMLLSMLSGSDSQRIKDIIAGAVEDAIANDTTGEFKTRIKNIIIAQLDAGNETVKNSVKSAVNDYFMSSANDEAIKTIVKDLIDQAYATDNDEDPIRKFVKGYITTYLNNNHVVLDDMIRDLGATLDPNNEADKYIIGLIENVLNDNNNVNYLKELVDGAIEDLHNMDPDSDLYKFIVGSIEEELKSDPDELAEVIRAIGKEDVEDIQPVLETVLEDDAIFTSIVTSALEDDEIFKKVISAALDNVTVFETIVKELCTDNPAFYNMLVDTAFSSTTLTSKVVDAVVSDNAALEAILTEAAKTDSVKKLIIDKILEIGDEALKDTINDGLGGTDYYDSAYAAAMEVLKAQIDTLLSGPIDDENDYYQVIFDEAYARAKDEIDGILSGPIYDTNDYYQVIFDEANARAKVEIDGILSGPIATTNDYYQVIFDEAYARAKDEIDGILSGPIATTNDYYQIIYNKLLDVAKAEISGVYAEGTPEWNIAVEAAKTEIENKLAAGLSGDDFVQAQSAAYAEAEQKIKDKLAEGLSGDDFVQAQSAAYAEAERKIAEKLEEGLSGDDLTQAKTAAYAKAETTVTNALTGGVHEGDPYWDEVYEAAKSVLGTEISNNFESKLSDAISDPATSDQIKTVASDMLLNNAVVNATLKSTVTNLGTSTKPEDVALKETIIDSVINYVANTATDAEKDEVINSIITELLKAENATLKEAVTAKAISVINEKGDLVVDAANNTTLKESIIDSVIADVFADDTLKNNLIEKLIEQVQLDDNLKNTVIAEGIYAIVNDEHVNEAAINLINKLIETDAEFKTDIVEHIVDYVLNDDTARAQAIEKVITKIESNDTDRNNAIEFAFNALKNDAAERDKIVGQFLTSILGDATKRSELATDVIDVMFDNPTLRNKILDIGFEQMFSSTETIKEIVKLALDSLISDDSVRRELILAVVSDETGRKEVLDLLFAELDRDPTFIDQMVDIAMKGKYGDMVDKFVYDLINGGVIEINPDNRQIAEEIVLPMLDDITLDTVMARLPARITDVLPAGKIEQIFNKFKSKARELLVEGIEEAKEGNSKVIPVMIDNDIDVINDMLIPAYNKLFPKVVDKAEDFYYYNENAYVKALVDMVDPEYLLDHTQPASSFGTGYRVKSEEFYYELLRNTLVLTDDAVLWYFDHISSEQVYNVIAKLENAYTKYIGKLNNAVGDRLPMAKLDKVVNTAVKYAKKAVDNSNEAYNVTTTGVFERIDSLYDKIISVVKERVGVDISTETTIEVTFDGSELIVNGDGKINIDNYKINVSVKGYTFKLDSHSVTVGGKTVDISGYVQKIADIFGTRSVTVRFTESNPYVYELCIGNDKVTLSAVYE